MGRDQAQVEAEQHPQESNHCGVQARPTSYQEDQGQVRGGGNYGHPRGLVVR